MSKQQINWREDNTAILPHVDETALNEAGSGRISLDHMLNVMLDSYHKLYKECAIKEQEFWNKLGEEYELDSVYKYRYDTLTKTILRQPKGDYQ